MAWILGNEHEERFINELHTFPDRVVALLGQTIVDRRLEAAIKVQWTNNRKGDLLNELFQPSGPIGSTWARIRIGFAIGLYGQDAFNDLEIINRVRNGFAHQLEIEDFKSQQIADRIKNLVLPDRYPTESGVEFVPPPELWQFLKGHIIASTTDQAMMNDPRERYMRSVEILAGFLWHEEYFSTHPQFERHLPPSPRF